MGRPKRSEGGREYALVLSPSGLFLPWNLSLIADAITSYFSQTCASWCFLLGLGTVCDRLRFGRGRLRLRVVRGRRVRVVCHARIVCAEVAMGLGGGRAEGWMRGGLDGFLDGNFLVEAGC